jgi:protein required for attachment to host cells
MKSVTHRTWIAIADGGQARILLNTGRTNGVQQVPHAFFRDSHKASHELGTERPPRVHESQGGVRHAIEPRSDPHEQRKVQFLQKVSRFLNEARRNKEFDSLIVVAPAHALGSLRHHFSTEVTKSVIAEIVHDYSHQDNETIYKNIKDSLPL